MRSLNILFLSVVLSFSTQAYAQSVFLVQLGSYPNEQEANETWGALKKAHQPILGDLFHQNSAISLPPSGAKVYRLQAGPFITREDATSACNNLSQKGEDCFIVESATFAPKEPATTKVAVDEAVEKEAVKVAAATPALSLAKAAEAPKPALAAIATEEKSESLFDSFISTFSSDEEEKIVASPSKTEVLKKVAVANAELPASLPDAPKAPVVEAKSAMAEEAPSAALPWGKKPNKKLSAIVKPATLQEAPKPELQKVVEPKVVEPVVTKNPAEAPKETIVASALPEKLPFGRVGDPYSPIAAPTSARKEVFAPPTALSTPVLPTPQMTPIPASEPKNISVPAKEEVVERRLTQNDIIAPTDSRVEVDEAIQVPLSERTTVQAAPTTDTYVKPEIALSGKESTALRASPSRNLLQHAQWVQLSYFRNEQAALNQWQLIRRKLPVLSQKLRVRVTAPYVKHSLSKRVSLQVGPFATAEDVTKVCAAIATENITCGSSKDIGVSTSATHQKVHRNQIETYTQRRDIVSFRPSAEPQYWVQLGSYPSRTEASQEWDSLRTQNTELQGHLPAIVEPPLSSSAKPVYRLRTGPFQIKYAATELCETLSKRGTNCLVISE